MRDCMETSIDEIASGVYRLSIFVPETAPPAGFTYNHFLIAGDEPLLFHCGKRKMFPLLSAAVARIMPVGADRTRRRQRQNGAHNPKPTWAGPTRRQCSIAGVTLGRHRARYSNLVVVAKLLWLRR